MNIVPNSQQDLSSRKSAATSLADALRHFGSKILLAEHAQSPEWVSVCRAAEEGLADVAAVGLEVFMSHLGDIYTASEKLLLHTLAGLVRARRYRALYRLVGFLDKHGQAFSPVRAA